MTTRESSIPGAVPAPIPENETERLAALRSYRIVDTLPEEVYDDVVFLASTICQTPIALISFVDEDRQFLKARVGLDVTETPRDVAFCAHAILEPGPLVVNDAAEDPRFAKNPLVTGGPGIRFYAGAPIRTPEGFALGTVCAIDRRPRGLTAEQERALTALARQVTVHLELRGNIVRLEAALVATSKRNKLDDARAPVSSRVGVEIAIERARAMLGEDPAESVLTERIKMLLARLEALQDDPSAARSDTPSR
jgi:two-component system NtrC family sensor kinase